jgi:ABC-type uncharacterized transport system auxiliary subunit
VRSARIAALLAALATAGCLAGRPVVYYELPYEAPAEPVCTQPLPLALGVSGLEAVRGRERPALAFRSSPYRLGFYATREWIARPDDMLSAMLVRALVDSGCFVQVLTPPYGTPVDLELGGTLERIESVEHEEHWSGAIAWRLALFGPDGVALWRGRVDREQPAAEQTPEAVVAALSGIVRQELPAVVHTVHETAAGLASRP